ncbi:MAG: sensor domain-containing diguanylate cyclase [Nocardioides sp.]
MLPRDEFTRIRSLASLARATGRSGTLNDLLEAAAESAREALGAASVSVSRLEHGTGLVRTILNIGDLGPTEERWPEDETYTISEFSCLTLITQGATSWTTHVDDPGGDRREQDLLRELGKGSSMGAPLIVDGMLWGEFFATRLRRDEAFGPDETAYLEALTAILAGAVSRALREESLEEMAYRDPLTGLANRRALDERAESVFDHGDQTPRPVSVIVADINGLKKVNDTQGHLVGDQLIKAVAGGMLRHFSRLPGALVARVGGDEFTVLVVGHDPSAVLEVSDELCNLTWNLGFPADLSCGAASVLVGRDTPYNPRQLFAAADRAQYVAKRGRLRRTVMADEIEAVSTEGFDAEIAHEADRQIDRQIDRQHPA